MKKPYFFFRKLVKIGFWVGFGPIWDPDSNSAWKTAPGDSNSNISLIYAAFKTAPQDGPRRPKRQKTLNLRKTYKTYKNLTFLTEFCSTYRTVNNHTTNYIIIIILLITIKVVVIIIIIRFINYNNSGSHNHTINHIDASHNHTIKYNTSGSHGNRNSTRSIL